jgi:hypothetical protein
MVGKHHYTRLASDLEQCEREKQININQVKGLYKEKDDLQSQLTAAREALGLDDCVIAFAKRMQYKLDKNKYKGGWQQCTDDCLFERIEEEMEELTEALWPDGIRKTEEILNECADIANFAMMIFDNILADIALADGGKGKE